MFLLYSKAQECQEQNIVFFKNTKKVYEKHLPKGLIRKAGSGRYTRHLEFRAFRGKLQARKEDDTIVNFANAKP